MANYKSAKKRIKVNSRNQQRNIMIKSKVKTAVKKVYLALKGTELEQVDALAQSATSQLDKAQAKGILHKNTVARKKSRMMARLSAAKTAG